MLQFNINSITPVSGGGGGSGTDMMKEMFGENTEHLLDAPASNGMIPFFTEDNTKLVFKGIKNFFPFNSSPAFDDNTTVTVVSCPDMEICSTFPRFTRCTSLASVSLPKMRIASGNAFSQVFTDCTALVSVTFDVLEYILASAFQASFRRCTSLQALYFTALRADGLGSQNTQFNQMLQGVTGCTVHFPSNLEDVIGTWSSVTSGFSGTNTTVLFDLPATN